MVHFWCRFVMVYLLLSWIPALRLQMYFDVSPYWEPTWQGRTVKIVWMISMLVAVVWYCENHFQNWKPIPKPKLELRK